MARVNQKPSILVFDIDDTLYLERDYVKSGFKFVGNYINDVKGIPDFGDRCWDLFQKGFRGDIFDQVCSELGPEFDSDLIKSLIRLYREHEPDIHLDKSVVNIFNRVSQNYTLAVITGGPKISQEKKVHSLNIKNWTNLIFYSGSLGKQYDKPNKWAFELLEQTLGYKGQDIIYFADNPSKDFAAPLILDWQMVRIRLKGSEHEKIKTPKGILEVSSFHEAFESID